MKSLPRALLLLLLMAASEAQAGPCESMLCLGGKLQGQDGGSECTQPISDYFNIIRYGKHGRFDSSATSGARLDFLSGCPNDSGGLANQINASYGAVRSLGF